MIPSKPVKTRRDKPSSDLQRLAQQENFAIFQLKGIIGNLHQMKRCATIPQSSLISVIHTLESVEKKIKHTQAKRKEAKQISTIKRNGNYG